MRELTELVASQSGRDMWSVGIISQPALKSDPLVKQGREDEMTVLLPID